MEENEFKKIVAESSCIADCLRRVKRAAVGSNYSWFKKTAEKYSVDFGHFVSYCGESLKKGHIPKDFAKVFNEDSSTSRSIVRKRIIRDNLIDYKCKFCESSEWRGIKLSLVLDHINGKSDDNRLENLRWLCPNCNSQTDTFAGRNKRKGATENICSCGTKIMKSSETCKKCGPGLRGKKFKIDWPTPDEMQAMLKIYPISKISEKLGVSDSSVHKFCKSNKLEKQPNGFFLKKNLDGGKFIDYPVDTIIELNIKNEKN